MKNKEILFFLLILLFNAVISVSFLIKIHGRTITVDGNPSDWLADTSGQAVNTGHYYSDVGEYVWKDAEDDDVGDGDYTYPLNTACFGTANNTADLLEFRVTYDSNNIYFLIKLVNVSNAFGAAEGFSVPIVTVYIDQDRMDGSGQEWTAQYMDATFNSTCWWEYVVVIKGGGSYVLDKNWANLGSITVKGSEEYDIIEALVPQSKIGSPIDETWRFMVYVGLEEFGKFREIDEVASEWHGGGGVGVNGTTEYPWWVECDAYDGAFYTTTANQALDWSDYNVTAGTATILCNILGEGYADIDFSQLPLKSPSAAFKASPLVAKVGETVNFDASASSDVDGYIVSYTWDFGDGNTISDTDPYITHSYSESGVYRVTLNVTDNDGLMGSISHLVVVIETTFIDPTNDFALRPYQDLKEFSAVSDGTHLVLNITVEGWIPDGGWNFTNFYIAIHTSPGGNSWFPDYIDAKYPDEYEYAWEYCVAIHNSTDVSLLNVTYTSIKSYNASLSPDRSTVSVSLPLADIGNPENVSIGVVSSEDFGRCKDTIGMGTVGIAAWGQWVEVYAAITNLPTTAGAFATASDTKPSGKGLGKAFYDFTEVSYGMNSTHLIVASIFNNVTGLDNSWVWSSNWRLSIAIDIDHAEASGQPYIAFMGGDVRIHPDYNATYWEYCVLVDSPADQDLHFYNSTWYDFGANGTKAHFIEEGKAMAVVIPRSNLPDLVTPTLTVISGEDAGNTLYDLIGTYTYNYTESPQGVYQIIPPTIGHDIAVTQVIPWKTVVGQGYSININVTVINEGEYAETFNVTIYANITIAGSQIITLPSGNSAVLTIVWDTTGFTKGNYTIWAYAWPVSGEIDTEDNTLVNGWVFVSIVGDITGGSSDPWDFIPDKKVSGIDITIICRCFGSSPTTPSPTIWSPNADINNNNKVDGIDITLTCRNFGQSW